MKATRHNGRTGTSGTFLTKHNDRDFNVENSSHIDATRTAENIYWDCFNGFRSGSETCQESFDDVERQFYEQHYQAFVDAQNLRNEKIRHTERNRTIEDIRCSKKTCPEETILQIGTMEDHIDPETLLSIVMDFNKIFEKKFGSNVHILDFALHLDEQTPHVHQRQVFDGKNRYGELFPQQEEALKELGFELPEPDKKPGRFNNRKLLFDKECRQMFFDVARAHGLNLDEEPEYGGRRHLEKQDFIIQKQNEKITEQEDTIKRLQNKIVGQNIELSNNASDITKQENELDTLTMKMNDIETLLDDLSEVAYDKAVETVTDITCEEVQKEDIQVISDYRDWILLPERKAPQNTREYTARKLDAVITRIKDSTGLVLKRVKNLLRNPFQRRQGIATVKEKATESILEKLREYSHEVDNVDNPFKVVENERVR